MNILILGLVLCLLGIVVLLIIGYEDFIPLPVAFIICIVISMGVVQSYKNEAAVKAKMINREYGTNYTAEEMFYAEDVIDTIQQIKRTRIDIQGLED